MNRLHTAALATAATVACLLPAGAATAAPAGSLPVAADVSATLGGKWTAAAAAPRTPCREGAGAADPDHTLARSAAFRRGSAGDGRVEVSVEQSASVAAARGAYRTAVRWFSVCGGKGTLVGGGRVTEVDRLARASVGTLGISEARIVVRDIAEDEGQTLTVAGVVRSGARTTVVTWDYSYTDNPYDFDDGIVALLRTAAARSAGRPVPAVPAARLLPVTAPALEALVRFPAVVDQVALEAPDGSCVTRTAVDRTVRAGRMRLLVDRTDRDVRILQTVLRHSTAAAARKGLAATARAATCTGVQVLESRAGARSFVLLVPSSEGGRNYLAGVQVGRLVSYVSVESSITAFPQAEIDAVVAAAARRLA